MSPASAVQPTALEQDDALPSAVVGEVSRLEEELVGSGVGAPLDTPSPEQPTLPLEALSAVRKEIQPAVPTPPAPPALPTALAPPLQPIQRSEQSTLDASPDSSAAQAGDASLGIARFSDGDGRIEDPLVEPRAATPAILAIVRARSNRAQAVERPGRPADRAALPAEFPRRDRDTDRDVASMLGLSESGSEGSSSGGGTASAVLWHVTPVAHGPERLALLTPVVRPRDGPAGEPMDRPG